MIQTRVDRTGALRRIDEIRERKPDRSKNKSKAIAAAEADEDNGQKLKLNIFDAQDSTVLKHETLARIGLDQEQQPGNEESMSDISRTSSNHSVRLKPIDYLNKTRQQKESVRDFI